MIEWIIINKETKFPKNESFIIIDKDKNIYSLELIDDIKYGEIFRYFVSNNFKCHCEVEFLSIYIIDEFTHYALINYPLNEGINQ